MGVAGAVFRGIVPDEQDSTYSKMPCGTGQSVSWKSTRMYRFLRNANLTRRRRQQAPTPTANLVFFAANIE